MFVIWVMTGGFMKPPGSASERVRWWRWQPRKTGALCSLSTSGHGCVPKVEKETEKVEAEKRGRVRREGRVSRS